GKDRGRVIGARGSAGVRAGAPAYRIVGVRIGVGVAADQRVAVAVRGNGPLAAVFVLDGEDFPSEGGVEGDGFAAVVELAGVDAVEHDSRLARSQGGGVAAEEEEL